MKSVEEFHEVMVLACRESFRTRRVSKKAISHKTVPWWTEELTIMGKRLNALRRRYQSTRNNGDLREQRRSQYLDGKAMYAATIKKEKIISWNEYCNMTSSINPWNEVYKLAAGKRKNNTKITTLRKRNGILTADIRDTLKHMLEYFTPEDKETDDTDYYNLVRTQAQDPADIANDKDFTLQKIRNTVESVGNKNPPGEDGITGEIYESAFETFPGYITAYTTGVLKEEFSH